MEPWQTYCFDDVAQGAVRGETPILCAVCSDPTHARELCDWLETAVPAFDEAMTVERISADQLLMRVARAGTEAQPIALVVEDATQADDKTLEQRWHHWNLSREALRAALLAGPPGVQRTVILVATKGPFHQVAARNYASDLLSLTTVMTVEDTLPALDPSDKSLYESYLAAARELQARYSLTTREFVRRLYDREELPEAMPQADLARWRDIASRLRGNLPHD